MSKEAPCENCGKMISSHVEGDCSHCGLTHCGYCVEKVVKYKSMVDKGKFGEDVLNTKKYNQCPRCGGWHALTGPGFKGVDNPEEDFGVPSEDSKYFVKKERVD